MLYDLRCFQTPFLDAVTCSCKAQMDWMDKRQSRCWGAGVLATALICAVWVGKEECSTPRIRNISSLVVTSHCNTGREREREREQGKEEEMSGGWLEGQRENMELATWFSWILHVFYACKYECNSSHLWFPTKSLVSASTPSITTSSIFEYCAQWIFIKVLLVTLWHVLFLQICCLCNKTLMFLIWQPHFFLPATLPLSDF